MNHFHLNNMTTLALKAAVEPSLMLLVKLFHVRKRSMTPGLFKTWWSSHTHVVWVQLTDTLIIDETNFQSHHPHDHRQRNNSSDGGLRLLKTTVLFCWSETSCSKMFSRSWFCRLVSACELSVLVWKANSVSDLRPLTLWIPCLFFQEFHETLHSLLLWLAQADKKLRAVHMPIRPPETQRRSDGESALHPTPTPTQLHF